MGTEIVNMIASEVHNIIYSLVIPIYNEEDNIGQLYDRICIVMNQLAIESEIILVDDGSSDRSLAMIQELRIKDPRVRYLSLARNFGHQIAITAGLNFVQGQAAIVMDADLQDPPELVPDMLKLWHEGFKIVYAQRIVRKDESWLKRLSVYFFYRILKRLADIDIPIDTGDFCLMDRQVIETLNEMPERNRYVRGLRAWTGFPQTAITYERDGRFAGESKYPFTKLISLAIDGIVSFSRVPLRLASYLGLITAIFAIVIICLVIYWRLTDPYSQFIGFAMITVSILFLGAVQLICIGILGEYIGRIYEEVKRRPIYTLKEIGGLNHKIFPNNTNL
jgi:dolichol-phosphate mannosyltransferase